ncbi:unnamed protein product [Bemisia tabaci]|uniref:Uncharacterized protein n=1 Tax=Bemisia tabaci TaxID=7038 RepID=A0A9N9ZYE0_BEMTA|nr:unnamed protein product [Bemisia tabaci]
MDSLISNASTYESFFSDVFGSNSDSDCEDGSFDFSDPMINRKRQSSSPIQENEGLPPDDSPPKRKKSEEIDSSAHLMQAIKIGNFNEVQKILQQNPQLANLSRKEDPLHVAIRLCHIPIVRLLLLNGFNVDAPDYRGVTPIQLAVEKEQSDIVQLLLAHGANCNIRNSYGLGIIHTVIRKANPTKPVPSGIPYGEFDVLTKEQAKLINKEIFDKNYKILEVLLNSSLIDINLTSRDGKTALYYAVVGTNYEFATSLVKLLLSKDADINVQSASGKTALSRAMTLCRAEIIEQLLIKGASTEELINGGQMSPIAWGIARGRVDITELLLKYSSFNVNTRDTHICAHEPSLIHYSIRKANSNVTRCLINAGASIIVHCEEKGTKVSPFLHCSDDLSTQAEQSRKLLMEHLVLLQDQKLYKFSKEEKSYIFSNFQLELHLRKLQNELVALKKMKIPQTDYTFYDFATSTDQDAAQLIEIPAIDKYCAQKALSILYPGFCRLMCDRNKAGQARLELLRRQNSIENVKKYFSSNYHAKSSFMDKVMSRLNNRDLKHLLDAYDKL